MERKQQLVLKVEIPETILQVYLKTHTLQEIKALIAESGLKSFIENSPTLGYKAQELDSTW